MPEIEINRLMDGSTEIAVRGDFSIDGKQHEVEATILLKERDIID